MQRYMQLRDFEEEGSADDSDATEPIPYLDETVGRRQGHLPVRLFILMALLSKFRGGEKVFLIDAFSGQGAMSWAFQKRQKKVARLDIVLNPDDETLLHRGCWTGVACMCAHCTRGMLISGHPH